MNTRILNRDGKLPEDGWYQIEANGEHVNHRARVIQVIDAQAVDSINNRFSTEAHAAGENFAGLPIDKDHLSESEENPTEAFGWAMQVRNRDGILESRIDWTALGLPLIESKPGQPPAYKFFSTEYDAADCEKIGTRRIGNRNYDVIRPLRLAGLSLTNDPNNKGQRPISNRNGGDAGATSEHQPMHAVMKNALIKLLGMKADASDEDVVAECEKVKNRAGEADALKVERDELLTAQVESDLEKYKNRYKAENRETVKQQLITNRKATIALLDSIGEPEAAKPARITNRATSSTPADPGKGDDAQEAARAQRITNRALEIQKQKSARGATYPWAMAFSEASVEIPPEAKK